MLKIKKMITKVKKRDGKTVPFNKDKIEKAVYKALTFTKEGDKEKAREIADSVFDLLLRRFSREEVPTVEEIQNIVEEVLMLEDLIETARAYIIYREKRREVRDAVAGFDESTEIIEQYIDELDWQVKENANMTYSLQGLNQYSTSYISKKYWLNKIYPERVREAAKNQDFHIHDLNLLATYCCGWDLQDLLLRGFGGVTSKVESSPPKHLRPALGQIVNFFFTLQGESAGAQAMSNFDTFLAPFIKKDKLNYKQVKQAIQEFVFNCMVPTRVGFQCLSEDTEILTKNGWKSYAEVKKGDIIKTFNLEKNIIEDKKAKKVFKREYSGEMYRLLSKTEDQLISPGHRVVRKDIDTQKYLLEEVEKLMERDIPHLIPIAANNNNREVNLTNEEIRLISFIVKGRVVQKKGDKKILKTLHSIRKNSAKYEEVISILSLLKIDFSAKEKKEEKGKVLLSIDAGKKLKRIIDIIENCDKESTIPRDLLEMSQCQSKLFVEGYFAEEEKRYETIFNKKDVDSLQRIIVNAGYGFETKEKFSNKKKTYLLKVSRSKEAYIQTIKKVSYSGIIWSVNSDNETVVAKRKGKVFITGNTPFINISLDVKVPEFLKNQPVIIGGEPQDETYGEFQKEMDIFNNAFYEVLMEGDSKGRVFTFPIPTISITSDFDWENKSLDKMWEATAKYGINYFSNFVQSDMNPEDFRSMCLHSEEIIFVKDEERVKKVTIEELFNEYKGRRIDEEWFELDKEIKSISLNPETGKTEWVKISKFLQITDNKMITIKTKDNKKMNVSSNHLVAIITNEGIKTKKAKEVAKDDLLLTLKKNKSISEKEISELFSDINNETAYLDGVNLSSEKIEEIKNSDYIVVGIEEIETKEMEKFCNFYDIELEKNHYFVHSEGNITHNCCRLRLDNKELVKRGGGLFGSQPLTGSIGVVTINLPRIGYLSKTREDFFNRLADIMDLAKESLEIKRKVLDDFIEKGLYPYTRHYLSSVKKLRGSYFGNHFSTIGLIGMNETLLNFLGESTGTEKGRRFALEVLKFMRERLVYYQEKTGNLYNLEATPGEGASFRQARIDKEKYPDIITAGTKEAPYYTNSVHLPVGFTDDPFQALDLQDDLQANFTGGTVLHLFLGERIDDPDMAKRFVKKVFDNYHLPYITLSPTFSICSNCGYIKGEVEYCPNCRIKAPKKVVKKIN